jgi:hypothetical protein
VHWIPNRYAFGIEVSDLEPVAVLPTTSFVAANSYATITTDAALGYAKAADLFHFELLAMQRGVAGWPAVLSVRPVDLGLEG